MGFYTNYEKANTLKFMSSHFIDVLYKSQDLGNFNISVLFNVSEIDGKDYIMQKGTVGIWQSDVDPSTGDEFVDEEGRTWYVEGFEQQKKDMIFMSCYANNEATYET